MTVRQSLLAILAEGPCYGNQLRGEFERRTGWPLNVGQVYTTLDRLERDGLATKGMPDAAGLVVYAITTAGAAEAHAWLSSAVDRPTSSRDELALKLALAITLPGADATTILFRQRGVTSELLARLRGETTEDLSRRLVIESLVLSAEAELAWLDRCEVLVADAVPYGLGTDAPRRGRPITTRL